jgi:uncharacterized membrane protein YqhA
MARQQAPNQTPGSPLRPLPSLIFASRWLQLPLYLGLIAAQGVYVWHFLLELWHLIEAAFGNQEALQALITSIGYKHDAPIGALNETFINAGSYDVKVLMWQTIIHVTFLASALAIAYTDKLINSTSHHGSH